MISMKTPAVLAGSLFVLCLNPVGNASASPLARKATAPTAADVPCNARSRCGSRSGHEKDAYQCGLADYKAKNYASAVVHFEKVIEKNPDNAIAYYYLANSLAYQRRYQEAVDAYKSCYELEPFGMASGFCRQALLAYKVSLPAVSNGNSLKGKNVGNRQEVLEATVAVNATPYIHPAVGQMRKTMRRQLEHEKARTQAIADGLSANVIRTANDKAMKIRAQAEDEIANLSASPMYVPTWGMGMGMGMPMGMGMGMPMGMGMGMPMGMGMGVGMPYGWMTPVQQPMMGQQAEAIRRQANDRAEMEKSLASERARQYSKWSNQHNRDLEDTADNLEEQLYMPQGRSGIALSPIGTGLYVRNYVHYKPKNPLPDAHASVVRLTEYKPGNYD